MVTLTPYQEKMAVARRKESDVRYFKSVALVLHAIYMRDDDGSKSVLYHIRGLCGDNCRWCKIG